MHCIINIKNKAVPRRKNYPSTTLAMIEKLSLETLAAFGTVSSSNFH